MKRLKLASLLSVAASMTLVLGACGGGEEGNTGGSDKGDTAKKETITEEKIPQLVAGEEMKDGTYRLEENDFDSNGWKVEFEIVVKGGKITESKYNYLNAEGTLKTDDEGYQTAMSDKTGVGPQDFVPQLNDALIETQNADQVEVVSGATHSSESFKNYAQQLIQAAQAGDTEGIEIANTAALQDGDYAIEEKNIGSTGWKSYIHMTVKEGKIATVDYNYLNAEGQLKTDDEGYQENMKDKTGTGPQEFVPALIEALVKAQNVADVEVVSGATHSSHTFKLYAAQLVNAAQKGETETIIVDNFVYGE